MKKYRDKIKYKDYELEDFLGDEFFIAWAKNPEGEEGHFWDKWTAENVEKRQVVMEAASIIRSLGYLERPTLRDKAYLEIFENVLRSAPRKAPEHRHKPSKSPWQAWFGFQKVAAAVLFAFCAWALIEVYVFGLSLEEPPAPIVWESKETPPGIRSTLKLGDGSVISLNSTSKLSFPSQFTDSLRLVKLEGEAFFDIQKDGRPFIVVLGETQVEVMGTTFNIRNPGDGALSVALVSGKVKVKDKAGNQVILKPTEMLNIHKNGELSLTSFDPLEVTGWKDKVLVFRKADKGEIMRKIGDWYGVEVSCDPRIQGSWSYSGEYKNESLENVLEGIKRTIGIEYEINGKQVRLKARGDET